MRWGGSGGRDAAHGGAGEIIRRLHWRAWDPHCAAPDVTVAEMMSVLPVLVQSGSVGMVWPRLRALLPERFPADGAVGAALEAAFRSQEAHNAEVARDLGKVVSRLREHSVEPVLIKGLAVARLYPAGLVRAAGDIDLVVRDEDYRVARRLLLQSDDDFEGVRLSYHGDRDATRSSRGSATSGTNVDLHAFSNWGQSPGEGFFERCERVMLGSVEVLVPSTEDHLRALCKHFLVHGATRPLRLCDIALLFESRAADFDWDRLLSGRLREIEQVVVTLGIAHVMLGMDLRDTPIAEVAKNLPRWLIPTVQRQMLQDPGRRTPLRGFYTILKNPWRIAEVGRTHWPDPISASVRTGAPLSTFPRLPIQLALIATRLFVFGIQVVPRDIVDRWSRR